jgi:Cu(I)/Ag(I) efflux system membrane fusion protein
MKLVLLETEDDLQQDASHSENAGTGLGRTTVKISPEKQQLIGVKTAPAETMQLQKIIRAVGIIEHDQTKEVHVHTKVSGLIEQLFVTYDGQHVKKGEPIYSIYSPDLVSTQEEYFLAVKNEDRLKTSSLPEIRSAAKALLEATKRRLLLWDVSEKEINEIEKMGKPKRAVTFYAPITGVTVEKHAIVGEWFDVGGDLYHFVDLTNVWVVANVYEYELALVEIGQEAKVQFSYLPGEIFNGKITFMDPHLDMKTRTAKVRIELPNTEHRLQPGMFANVNVEVALGEKLAIPESAVLDTGTRKIIFLDRGEGKFEPREVRLGQKAEGYYEVLSGLTQGDKVVTSGNFLIDSESQLKAALGDMGGHQHGQ